MRADPIAINGRSSYCSLVRDPSTLMINNQYKSASKEISFGVLEGGYITITSHHVNDHMITPTIAHNHVNIWAYKSLFTPQHNGIPKK